MIGFNLPGVDPAAAAARKLQKELEAKKAARAYEQHCAQCGMNPIEAHRLAPPLVKKGQALRRVEAKQRREAAFRAKKEQMARRFG